MFTIIYLNFAAILWWKPKKMKILWNEKYYEKVSIWNEEKVKLNSNLKIKPGIDETNFNQLNVE